MKSWFEVDRSGLAKLLGRRSKGFVVTGLIQNAWDEDVSRVDVKINRENPGSRYVIIQVEDDDPDGFKFLDHAYTLFAESTKKGDPQKRGRFNLGGKLVLAVCREARIESTKGSVFFDEEGRHTGRTKRQRGSLFRGVIQMTREEEAETLRTLRRLIQPIGISTLVEADDQKFLLSGRSPVVRFEVTLPTELADAEGYLRRTTRKCELEVYEPAESEVPSLYELGIPVVETGDRYHVNVMQKVPLNQDRDNVPPAYLRSVRTFVMNHVFDRLNQEEVNGSWAREATSDERIDPAAMKRALDLRYGEKRVAYDPSDSEANKTAVAAGYTVIPGGAMSRQEWENARAADLAPPAGRLFPSPKPFADGPPVKLLDVGEETEEIVRVVAYAEHLGYHLLSRAVTCRLANDPGWQTAACYGPSGDLYLNVARLGRDWFARSNEAEIDRLLIHEFAHEYVGDHLSEEYHSACCRLGAKLKRLALDRPDVCRL